MLRLMKLCDSTVNKCSNDVRLPTEINKIFYEKDTSNWESTSIKVYDCIWNQRSVIHSKSLNTLPPTVVLPCSCESSWA